MAKRGFFAELRHQERLAEQRRAQAMKARAREHAAAVRNAEQAKQRAARAAVQAARASAAEQKAAEREARQLHEEAKLAEVESLNAALAEADDELETILTATLDVENWVDLEALRLRVTHPPFPDKDLEVETPMPVPPAAPVEPVFVEPAAPSGFNGVFGGRKKHEAAMVEARAAYAAARATWRAEVEALPEARRLQLERRGGLEERRLRDLKVARNRYESQCKASELEAAASNKKLDAMISGIQSADPSAIREYIGIVLGNSVYPERLQVRHEYGFDPELKELELTVLVGPPECVPDVKSWRYVRAKDEIASTARSKKDLKDRYAGMVFQTALRTLHEVFEADRAAEIATVALTVVVEANDLATGRPGRIPLVAVGADRVSFQQIDLSNVVPSATLQHLGASLSKNPYELAAIDGAPGVRSR